MKTLLLLLAFTVIAATAPPPPLIADGATITIGAVNPGSLERLAKQLNGEPLPVHGTRKEGQIHVVLSGTVMNPGTYFFGPRASLTEAIAAAGGLQPMAVSKFAIFRHEKFFPPGDRRHPKHPTVYIRNSWADLIAERRRCLHG